VSSDHQLGSDFKSPTVKNGTGSVTDSSPSGWTGRTRATRAFETEKDGSRRKPCGIGRQQIRRCLWIADWRIGEEVDNGYARGHLVQHRLHLTRIRAVQPKIREQRNHVVSLPNCGGALQRSRVSKGNRWDSLTDRPRRNRSSIACATDGGSHQHAKSRLLSLNRLAHCGRRLGAILIIFGMSLVALGLL
jgi:hypothetical protein